MGVFFFSSEDSTPSDDDDSSEAKGLGLSILPPVRHVVAVVLPPTMDILFAQAAAVAGRAAEATEPHIIVLF